MQMQRGSLGCFFTREHRNRLLDEPVLVIHQTQRVAITRILGRLSNCFLRPSQRPVQIPSMELPSTQRRGASGEIAKRAEGGQIGSEIARHLRLDYLLPSVLVDKFQGSARAPRTQRSVGRVRFAVS